ncbi:GNAT family N-acetyltransferase [bacterium]|nr:GNAT family N-acetyltransferase [bacterium]
MDDTILSTKRLVLRYQRKSDIEFLVYLWMDEEMTKYTGGPREKQTLIDEFRRISENPREEEYNLWTIESKASHNPIGHAGFIPKEIKGKQYIELNYYIDKEQWSKGYGKEIARGLLDYAFKTKKLDQLIAIIDPENEPSKKVAKAIGMKYWKNEDRSGKNKSIYHIRIGETERVRG